LRKKEREDGEKKSEQKVFGCFLLK